MITGKLAQNLEHYIECKREHDEARDRYEGYSWDYHGRAYINYMEKAANEFERVLGDYIRERIREEKNGR